MQLVNAGSVLLRARLTIRERDQAEVRELALRLAPTKGATHAGVHAVNLLEPAGVEGLGSRNESRLLLRIRTGGGGALGSIAGFAAALGSRCRGRISRIVQHRHTRRLECTRTGLQSGRDVSRRRTSRYRERGCEWPATPPGQRTESPVGLAHGAWSQTG